MMNAKAIAVLGALGLAAAGSAYYFLGRHQAHTEAPLAPTAKVAEQPKLKPTELVAAKDPAPEAAAETPKDLPPQVKIIPNKSGDIYVDMQTKILTQEKKILIKKLDGTIMEQTVMLTAKPVMRPL